MLLIHKKDFHHTWLEIKATSYTIGWSCPIETYQRATATPRKGFSTENWVLEGALLKMPLESWNKAFVNWVSQRATCYSITRCHSCMLHTIQHVFYSRSQRRSITIGGKSGSLLRFPLCWRLLLSQSFVVVPKHVLVPTFNSPSVSYEI
jgi:hypothetical protein